MKTIIINGLNLSFAKSITGIQRACHEMICRLDQLLENEDDLIVKYIYNENEKNIVIKPKELKNIETIPVKPDGKKLWKTRILKKYVKKYNATLCCLSLETAFIKNQISFIYDVRPVTTKFDTFKFRMNFRLFMILQRFNAKVILTDSNFQKDEISKFLKINPNKIRTLYMGYEHILPIKPDNSIFEKHPQLKENNYYYILGSLAPHKNFKWVGEVAKRNPDATFAIAGGKDLRVWKDNVEIKDVNNLIFLGYVSDEESKALMQNCIAFIHPSKYEGFGIPPLEALACGAKIFVSNSTCLPEVYEDCAVYFSPDDYEVNLKEMGLNPVADPSKILKKCSWDKTAHELLEVLKKFK